MENVGLLAGVGRLPVEVAKAARAKGYAVCCVKLLPQCDEELDTCTAACEAISIAKLDKIFKFLKKHEVKSVTMIGKVTKELLFAKKVLPDFRMMKVLMSLPDRKDDTIMLAFVRELKKEGMEVFDQTALLHTLMPHHGTLTKREPTEAERRDMEYGFRVAKELGRLDISVQEFLTLGFGDVLQLDTKVEDELPVFVGKRPKYKCRPGTAGKNMAVQVTRIINEGDENTDE